MPDWPWHYPFALFIKTRDQCFKNSYNKACEKRLMHSSQSFAHLPALLFSSCCLVASLGRQTIFRLCTRGSALGQWRIHRNAVRIALGATCPAWTPSCVHTPSAKVPAFERLKNCPSCLVEPHSWTFLAPPIAPRCPSVCYMWENVFRIFALQDTGQRQLQLPMVFPSLRFWHWCGHTLYTFRC